jgi:hypothetical protein
MTFISQSMPESLQKLQNQEDGSSSTTSRISKSGLWDIMGDQTMLREVSYSLKSRPNIPNHLQSIMVKYQ